MRKLSSVTRTISGDLGSIQSQLVPQIEKFGDWEKARYMLSTIDITLQIALTKATKSFATRLRRTVRRNIRENGGSIGWVPLSPKTRKNKLRLGQDPDRILYATGLYYRSIALWKEGTKYYVGVKRGVKHGDTGKTVGEIARIHESGLGKVPARPLWSPSYRQAGGTKTLNNILIWHIRDQIFKKYGVRPKLSL